MSHPHSSSALASQSSPELAWVGRLIDATTPDEVGSIIVELAQAQPGCSKAGVLWMSSEGGCLHSVPPGLPGIDRLALAHAALQAADGMQRSHANQLALGLLQQERVALWVMLEAGVCATSWLAGVGPRLQLAARHLHHAMKLADLYDSHSQLEHSENLQSALFAISDLASSELDMPEMLQSIHRIVSTLMYGENFFIVKHDAERGTMRFLYYSDIKDEDEPDTTRDLLLEDLRHTLTWHLLAHGQPLMGNVEQLQEQVIGPLILSGPQSDDWLGVPILREGQVHGALVVQSYDKGMVYSHEDLSLIHI